MEMRHEIGVIGIACAKMVIWGAELSNAGSVNLNLPLCMTRILKSFLIWVDMSMMLEPLGVILVPHLHTCLASELSFSWACICPMLLHISLFSFHSSPHSYATIVLAVALSYLHVGGKTPTVL
jgi:hypothetical protein